jgi:preprotein translocase subunit SecA
LQIICFVSAECQGRLMRNCFPLKVETYFYDIRKQLFEYDAVVNSQRNKVYGER